jgi:hypothetical protein
MTEAFLSLPTAAHPARALRTETNFFSQFNKSARRANHRKPVNPLRQKYSAFQKWQIDPIFSPSRPERGALRNVNNAGRDAVDAEGARDESA